MNEQSWEAGRSTNLSEKNSGIITSHQILLWFIQHVCWSVAAQKCWEQFRPPHLVLICDLGVHSYDQACLFALGDKG